MTDSYAMTPADYRAVTGYNDGMFGGNISVLFLFFLLAWGNGGMFGANRGNVATTEDLASGFNFNSLQGKTNDILAAVNGVNQNIGNAICQIGYQGLDHYASLSRQMSECCCGIERNIDSVNYNVASQAAAINANTTAMTQKVLDKLCGMELAQKDAVIAQQGQRIAALEADARMCGVPRINPYGYGIYAYPTCTSCNSCANF